MAHWPAPLALGLLACLALVYTGEPWLAGVGVLVVLLSMGLIDVRVGRRTPL